MIPTFDIEAVNWIHPIAVGFFDGEQYHEFLKENEEDDVIWKFLLFLKERYQGIKIYAHCASKYDNKLILHSLIAHKEIAIPEAGLIRLKWEKAMVSFEDSYLLVPMSLRRACELFGVKDKENWEHSLQLNPWEMGESLSTFREYLKTDCLSLSSILYKVCELLGTTFGITPSISLSTTSAKAFNKCFYDLEGIDSNEVFDEYIRAATYGGRNEVYCRYGEGINLYDIKSMFVSCYDTPVPIGRLRWIKQNIDSGTLAEASVKVPKDWYLGPLPYRLTGGKLCFPTGEFTSWWDIGELRNAASLGVDITIRRQLCGDEEPVLESFGKTVSTLRERSHGEFWKVFGLSLTGKLGQSRWRDTIKPADSIKDLQGWFPLDEDEYYFQTKEYSSGRAPYIKPAVAMRIRSEARIRHLRKLSEAAEKGKIFYGDTDSVFTTSSIPSGNEVGQLSKIGRASRGWFIRQKLYGYILKGRLVQRSAGFSDLKLSEGDFQELLKGGSLDRNEEVLPSLRKVLKDKEIRLLEAPRLVRSLENRDNRVHIGNETEPINLGSH